MKPSCVDLRQLFGDKFKLDVEESYYAERPEFRKQEEPWLTFIVCQHGQIGVWGGSLLSASTNTSGPTAKRLKALAFVEVAQDGADGVNVTFDVEHFEEVAEIMKPRKRRHGRQMSEEERQRLIEAGRKYRFATGCQNAPEPRICDARGGSV